jgi:hypothetical protein
LVWNILSFFHLKKKKKKVVGLAQVLEHLPSKCEALSLNPSPAREQQQQKTPNE